MVTKVMGKVEMVQGMTQRREAPRMDSAGLNLENGPEGRSVEGSRDGVRVEGGKQGAETQRPSGGNTAAPRAGHQCWRHRGWTRRQLKGVQPQRSCLRLLGGWEYVLTLFYLINSAELSFVYCRLVNWVRWLKLQSREANLLLRGLL